MKRTAAIILSLLSICMCVLASCVTRDKAGGGSVAEAQPGQYPVTYYQGEQVLGQEYVTEGSYPASVPQGVSWRNESGAVVDPATVPVTRAMSFYARGVDVVTVSEEE